MSWPATLTEAVAVVGIHLTTARRMQLAEPTDDLLAEVAEMVGLGEGQNPGLLRALGAVDARDAARRIVAAVRSDSPSAR